MSFRFVLSTLLAGAMAAGISSPAAAAPLPVSGRKATAEEVGYLPRERETVAVNPPPLAWLGEKEATTWALELSREPAFRSPEVQVPSHRYLLYTHTAPLAEGTWYWRYRYQAGDGRLSEWSAVREFSIPAGAPRFPRPSTERLKALVPREHPRMFVRPERVEALRASRDTHPAEWKRLMRVADRALTAPLMQEPRPWTDGKWNADEWREYLKEIGPAVSSMEALGFAWMLTGERRYGDAARRALLHYASWEPLGTSSMKVNDEVGMPLLHGMSRTYSWIHDLLTKEEIEAVHRSMRARGGETLRNLRRGPYEQFAYNSHHGRMWHFLGEAGLAFYDEIPEAAEWLEYAFTILHGWYPVWGDADGGWAEGLWYWSSYNERVTWWFDLIRETLDLDGTGKPFYAHVGDFPLYVAPPGNPVSGFGDFSERPPPPVPGRVLAAYAKFRGNGIWQWYSDRVGGGSSDGPIGYLRNLRQAPRATPPADPPLLKIFSRAGYALFNTDMEKAERNIHLAMRASPYGNISHMHADQNAVVLAAFGEPLLVNTGARDYYGSPFCSAYYWHTRSHNALLLDDGGQKRAPASKGEFIAAGANDRAAFVVGDATPAYAGQADRYRRWAVLVRDEAVVLLDEVATTAPRIRLLWHGRAPFRADDTAQTFALLKGDVYLSARMFTPRPVAFSQTDRYPVPPAPGTKTEPEWHLTASIPAGEGSGTSRIVTVLVPFRKGKPKPAEDWNCQTSETETVVTWKAGDKSRRLVLSHADLTARLD